MSPLGKFLLENCFYKHGFLYIYAMDLYSFVEESNISSFEETIKYADNIDIFVHWAL